MSARRRQRLTRILVALAVAVVGWIVVAVWAIPNPSPPICTKSVVAAPGATLWSLASAAEPQADPRLVIQQIMALNGLKGSTIEAGALLKMPAACKKAHK